MIRTRRAVSTTTAILAIVVIVLAVAIIYLYYQQVAYGPAPPAQTPATPPGATIAPTGIKLPYDSANKTVYVTLETRTANYDFNGSNKGKLVIYIPAGWNLVIRYINNDPNFLPHSVGIIANNTATPRSPDPTKDGNLVAWAPDGKLGVPGYKEGIGSGETTLLTATSIQKGVYWIACGIPGHAISGQWIVLVASDAVTEPYYVGA